MLQLPFHVLFCGPKQKTNCEKSKKLEREKTTLNSEFKSHNYENTLYCQKYWIPPSNERFDYCSNFHEYKS